MPGDFLNFLYPWKAVTDGKVYNLDQFDAGVLFHPLSVYLSERLHLGDIPLWDPNIFCGFPIVASGYGTLYPPRLLVLSLFSGPVGMTLLWFAHVFGMGVGMYGWLRSRDLSKAGATLGGLCWMLSALNSAWLAQDFSLLAVYLAPMLWAFEQRRWGLLAIFGGLCLTGGHIQMAFYLGWIVGIYALARTFFLKQPQRLLGLSISGVGVLMIAAPAVLPVLELLRDSQRAPFTWETLQGFAAPIWSLLLTLINPDLLGNPSRGFMLNRAETNYPFCEYADYFGLIPLALALLALAKADSCRWKGSEIRFWGIVGFIALTFAAATPVYRLALIIAPVLSRGLPGRFLLVVVFVGCILAAHGFDIWKEDVESRRWVARGLASVSILTLLGLIFAFWGLILQPTLIEGWLKTQIELGMIKVPAQVADGMIELCRQGMIENYLKNPQFLFTVLASLVALAWVKRPRQGLLLAFVALDLLLHFSHFNTWLRPDQLSPKAPSIEYLQAQPGHFRVEKQAAAFYNTLTPYHLSLVTGYSGVIPSRFFKTISRAQSIPALMRSIDLVRFESPILSAMNLTYLLQGPFELPAPVGWEKVYDQEIRVFRNPRALPRVFVRGQVKQFSSFDDLLGYIGSPAFNPWSEALVESPLPGPVAPEASQAECQIRHYEPDQVNVSVELTAPGLLVLSESWYEGWRCRDAQGIEHPVIPVNGSSRGVYLPAGRHELEFRFEPTSYYNGLKLAALGLFLALTHTLWLRRR